MILILNDGKLCDLAVYFNRPINNIKFNDLTYSKIGNIHILNQNGLKI
jgi:hypothetical protein